MYRNRTDRGRCSHPPLVLKTRAGTSRANTPECPARRTDVVLPAAHLVDRRRRALACYEWDVGIFQIRLEHQHEGPPSLFADDQHAAAVVVIGDVDDWAVLAARHSASDPIGLLI